MGCCGLLYPTLLETQLDLDPLEPGSEPFALRTGSLQLGLETSDLVAQSAELGLTIGRGNGPHRDRRKEDEDYKNRSLQNELSAASSDSST